MKTFQYALIQIFHCILICVITGYATVFLLDKQFSNTIIGTVLSLGNVLGVFLQQVVATWVDNSKGKITARQVVMTLFVVMSVLSVVLSFLKQPTILFLIIFVLIVTAMGVLPPFISALIFDFEKQGIKINFGLARGMGSASYALTSLIMGNLTATYGTQWLPYSYILLSIIATMCVFTFKTSIPAEDELDTSNQEEVERQSKNFFSKYPLLTKTLVAVVLIFFGFNLTNSYLFQIVTNVGGNQSHLGIAMFIGAIVELPAMAICNKLSKKIGQYNIMTISAIFFGVKHTLLWLAPNLTIIYIAQLVQFFSYAFFLPTSVFLVSDNVEDVDAMKGQALMTGAISVGGVVASAIGGVLLDKIGVSSTLFCATAVSWIGSILLIMTMVRMSKK